MTKDDDGFWRTFVFKDHVEGAARIAVRFEVEEPFSSPSTSPGLLARPWPKKGSQR
jgi:hypothetical protein